MGDSKDGNIYKFHLYPHTLANFNSIALLNITISAAALCTFSKGLCSLIASMLLLIGVLSYG